MDDLWDDDEPVLSPPPRRSRRWRRLFVLGLATVALWQLPQVTLVPAIRDWPLQQAFNGIAGRLSSGGAEWHWFGPIVYRDVLLEASDGQPLLAVDQLTIGRSPFLLAVRPMDLGRIVVQGGRLSTAVWQGGSTVETVLEPWLARLAEIPTAPPPTPAVDRWGGGTDDRPATQAPALNGSLELIDLTVELIDLRHDDAWWITDLAASVPLSAMATAGGLLPIDTVVSGRLRHVGQPQLVVPGSPPAAAPAGSASVASRTAATLARDGGWSLTVHAAGSAADVALAVGGTRLPAGCSRLAASRFGWPVVMTGQLDLRADVTLSPPLVAASRHRADWQLACSGHLAGRHLSVRDANTNAERLLVDQLELPFGLSATADQLRLERLELETSLGRADINGTIRLPSVLPSPTIAAAWSWLETLAGPAIATHAEIDLAAVARSLAGGIALRPDVRVTGGMVELDLNGDAQGIELRAALAGLQAIQGTQDLAWSEPCSGWLRARRLVTGGLQLTEARLAAAAAELTATNRAGGIETTWRFDLGDLFTAATELFDLQPPEEPLVVAGAARGRLLVGRTPDATATTLSAAASLEDFSWSMGGRPIWQDDLVAIDVDAVGNAAADQVVLDQASLRIEAGGDLAAAALVGSCTVMLPAAGGGWPQLRARDGSGGTIDCRLTGGLDRWQGRLLGLLAGAGWPPSPGSIELDGQLDSSLTISSVGSQWQITKATGQIDSFGLTADGLEITEPRVLMSAVGSIDPERELVDLASAEVLTATASLRTKGLQVVTHDLKVDRLFDVLRGRLQGQADLARLQRWLSPTLPQYAASGRVWGTAELVDAGDGTSLLVELTGSQLAVAASPPPGEALQAARPIWNEPQLKASLDLLRPMTPARDRQILINGLVVESSTLGLSASGRLSDLHGLRQLDLRGTFATNFSQLTRLLTPASGGIVQLSGGGPRPFALSGSLNQLGNGVAEARTQPVELPVPQQWQQPTADGAGRLIALPKGRAVENHLPLAGWLANLSAETTLAWQGGRLAEFPVGPGELPVRLVEGQLAFGPFDIPVSGGRVRGAPWLQLSPPPGELVLPPGPLVEHVVLTPAICSHYLGWLSPLLRSATEASGRLSVETGGGRLPLADLLGGRLDGQLWLEDFAVAPGDMAGPLVNLLAQLQSVVDPRFAFGDRVVLLRARPEPIRVWLAAGRVHHDNLVLDMGQLSVRSKGSVGRDGSLAMQLEVAFRGDLAGATPVVSGLLRTPFVIPLRGTVRRPQFDATAIDTILARIMQNTADAVLRDGIGRGLEALFGNPQPPRQSQPTPAQPPLTFPRGS
jgi:hypothetical protein